MLPEEFARKICDSVDLLNNQVAGMQNALGSVQRSQEKLFNIVANGNGQPSLISQVSEVKTKIDAVKTDVSELKVKVDTVEMSEAACRARVTEQLKRRGNSAPEESRIKRYGLLAAIGTGVAAFFIKIFEYWTGGQ
jgi:phosphotransacetylase